MLIYILPMRARCSVYIAVSLDGFIARPDGRLDWLSLVERPNEDYGYRRFHETIDTHVVGRKTYESALGFPEWPYAGKRCVVMTSSRPTPRHGEEVYDGDPATLVDRLTSEGAKRIYVDGGIVIRHFLAAGLIADLTLSIIPVLLGEGVPLFGKPGDDIGLELRASRAFESGLVQLEYGVLGLRV
jgi:dihydrofolate reductase